MSSGHKKSRNVLSRQTTGPQTRHGQRSRDGFSVRNPFKTGGSHLEGETAEFSLLSHALRPARVQSHTVSTQYRFQNRQSAVLFTKGHYNHTSSRPAVTYSSEYLRHGLLFQLASLFDTTEKNETFSFCCPWASPSGWRSNCKTYCLNHCEVKLGEGVSCCSRKLETGCFWFEECGNNAVYQHLLLHFHRWNCC